MSFTVPITGQGITAPTPQNTPLNQAPIAQGLSRPTVPDIAEGEEPDDGEDMAPDLSQTQAHLLGMVQGRLSELIGKSSGYIENLSASSKVGLAGLMGLQAQQNELQGQLTLEIMELEKKYLEKVKPLYERRNAIINGKEAPTAKEVEEGNKVLVKDRPDWDSVTLDESLSSHGIPEFWLTALHNYPNLSNRITERDRDALKHLIDIRYKYVTEDGNPGFELSFVFSPNEYFENEILTKTYYYRREDLERAGDLEYHHATASPIDWKSDKDLTKEFEIKKQRNKNTNRTRLVRKARPADSFFDFFTAINPTTDEENEEEEEEWMADFKIGEELKDNVIPNAVEFFTGKALADYLWDDEDEDIETDEDEDAEDADDDDDDDDESDDEQEPSRRRGPPKNRSVNPEDCKQQ